MKDIEFITRIQVNGEKRELTKEEASELILRRVKEGERISFTYSEVAEDGTIISQNNKKNFLVLNKELKNHISEIKKYIEDNHLTE